MSNDLFENTSTFISIIFFIAFYFKEIGLYGKGELINLINLKIDEFANTSTPSIVITL